VADPPAISQQLSKVVADVGTVILGKEPQIRLALTCFVARGHLLIEDLPGVGKTTLAQTLAAVLGLDFQRIQFTSDLLPADILGTTVFDRTHSEFRFHRGPIFAQVILADEVNRATPKTQSALLEAMEEYQVTIDGDTFQLPEPFFVIATQNPSFQIGTFPLPESQLDRFLMRLELGYPGDAAERELLCGEDRRRRLRELKPTFNLETLLAIRDAALEIEMSMALMDYVQALLNYSRSAPCFHCGLSPRAGLSLVRCAQVWAMMDGRRYVVPEDVQAVLPAVAVHRLQPSPEHRELSGRDLVNQLLEVAIP